ncbi:MAG: hypothetical protein H6743_02370 [Rickettsiaceae bacterium]|nr:hypothetical protein [Rickettsiaceae bacterium]
MSKEQWVYSAKNSFSSGELTPTMEGRNDLPIYQHGVKKLINFMILPSGGITRRYGTQYAHVFKEKIPVSKRMINIMYLREYSFLVVFSDVDRKKIRIEVFINGEGDPVDLGTIDVVLDIDQFSYTTYQGAAYISFGINYPIWIVRIDPGQIQQLYQQNNSGNEGERKKLFYHDVFKVKGKRYDTDSSQQKMIGEMLFGNVDEVNKKLTEAAKAEITMLRTNSLSIFEGRLWIFGTEKNIHEIWASSIGTMDEFNLAYNTLLEARNPLSAFAATFVSSTFDNVVWSIPFAKELLLGTTDGIYVLKTGDRIKDEFVNIHKDIDISVANIAPIICGKTIFFVEGDRKKIHSLYYSEEKGGYQISCITTYAEHLFTSGIKQIIAVNSPFNMIFAVLNNGSFATFTYSQDLKIMGWSQHWLGGNGKVIEALAMCSTDSDKVYFRVRREGTLIEEEKFVPVVKEYIEYFDCKYLSGHIQNMIHEPLYADCYSHFKREGEDEIDQEFKQALRAGNVFEYKEDLSRLENLIVKQTELERAFPEMDIMDNFVIGGVHLNRLENVEEIGNSKPSVVSGIDLKPIYAEFIYKYFSKYLTPVQLLLGLEIAMIRKLQKFNGYVINILLGKREDIDYLKPIMLEASAIVSEIKKWAEEVQKIEINQHLKERKLDFITHRENNKYSFCIAGIIALQDQDRLSNFINFVNGMNRTIVMLRYYFSSPEYFTRDYKMKLLKEFNFRANYQLLKTGVAVNVENLDIEEYIEKAAYKKKVLEKETDQLRIEGNNLIVSYFILDQLKPEEHFIEYFKINEGELLFNKGILDKNPEELIEFFKQELAYIIAGIYQTYNSEVINDRVVVKVIIDVFRNFLNLLGTIACKQKEDLYGAIAELVDSFMQDFLSGNEEVVKLVSRKKIERQVTEIIEKANILSLENQEEFINNSPMEIRAEVLSKWNSLNRAQYYNQYIELKEQIDNYIDSEYEENDVDEGIAEYPEIVREALKNYWKEKTEQEIGIDWENDLFGENKEQMELISFVRFTIIGFLVESKHVEEINLTAVNDIENDFLFAQKKYSTLKEYDNKYLVLLFMLVTRSSNIFKDIFSSFITISNFLVPSEEEELLRISNDLSHPTKIDKYLLLSRQYFPIFRQNFPDIDIEMIKTLVRHINAGINKIESDELHKIYGGMKVGFIGDNELISNNRLPGVNLGVILLNGYVRFLSFGFIYSSILQTFPFIFEGEYEHIDKKDCAVGLKLFNTKGGYIEESTSKGNDNRQFINAPRLNLDNMQFYLSDKKYLMGEAIRAITTPYISGWVHFSTNRKISKDVDLVYVVDKPYPASILKIYAKAKLIPHYLN